MKNTPENRLPDVCRYLCGASGQIYIANDFLPVCVDVNKRIALIVVDVTENLVGDVSDRLVSLYGKDKPVKAVVRGKEVECTASDLPVGGADMLVLCGEKLTEHGKFDFSDLKEIMAKLRGEGGCEWDRVQTHESIRINLIEEAYELVEAIDCADKAMMLEESGDVLMQAVFHTQIAAEEGDFDFSDMLTALCRKLLDRHTHIFGDNHAENAEQALDFWNEAKKKEKKYKSASDAMDRVPKNLPSLLYAEKIQKIARKNGFDWKDVSPAAEKVREELEELLSAPLERRSEEGGDLLFAVVNVLRIMKTEAETALREANAKFFARFSEVERRVSERGRQMTDCTLEELDGIWNEVKADEGEPD